jgi:hypothetical protein
MEELLSKKYNLCKSMSGLETNCKLITGFIQ